MADKKTEKPMKEIFNISNKLTGKDRLIYSMSSTGERIAVSSTNSDTVSFYAKTGEKEEKSIVIPNEAIQKIELDFESSNLGILTKDKMYVCNVKSQKYTPILIDSEIGTPTCFSFSKMSQNLAIGTSQGGLMLINLKTQKKNVIASKHPKRVSYLNWSSTDALVSKSDDDTIHVSKENGELHEEFGEIRKQNLTEVDNLFWMDSAVLVHKMRRGGKENPTAKSYQNNLDMLKNGTQESKNPKEETFSFGKHSNHALVVVTKSGRELAVVCKAEGLLVFKMTFNPNQGRVIGVCCTPSGEFVFCTSRGFVTRMLFKDNAFVESHNDRLFQNSFEIFEVDFPKQKAYAFGDGCLKVLDLKTLKEERDLRVSFDKAHSSILSLTVSVLGGLILANSSSGSLLGFMTQSDQKGKVFNHVLAVKVSLNELSLKTMRGLFDQTTIDELESNSPRIVKFPGSEILDFICIGNCVVIAQHKQISCFNLDGKMKWKIEVNSANLSLQSDHKSKILVITPLSLHIVDTEKGQVSCTLNVRDLSEKTTGGTRLGKDERDQSGKPKSGKHSFKDESPFQNSKNHQILSDFSTAKILFTEYLTLVLDKSVVSMYDNSQLNLVHSMVFKGSVEGCFVDEKSMEFYFYETSENKLMVFRRTFDAPIFELPLPDKKPLGGVLFDCKNPNSMCLFHESGSVYSVCKKESHYKSPVSFHLVREILQPSDLSENSGKPEVSVTLLDPDILPVRLSDGFLFCLEKGLTPTGCHLSSHSFKMGSFGKFSDSISPKINTVLTQQSKIEAFGNKYDVVPYAAKSTQNVQKNQFSFKNQNETNGEGSHLTTKTTETNKQNSRKMDQSVERQQTNAQAREGERGSLVANQVVLQSFKSTPTKRSENDSLSESEKEYFLKSFFQTVELNLFSLSFKAADVLGINTLWNILAVNSLKNLDLDIAQSCYQKLENWSMSYYIKYLKSQNKKISELRADVAVILCDYEFAKNCFLQNGKTCLAIELSMNLQEYSQALELAQKEGLVEYEIMASYELAEIDSKNEELIKSESVYLGVLKKLDQLCGIKTLNVVSSKRNPETGIPRESGLRETALVDEQLNKRNPTSENSENQHSNKPEPPGASPRDKENASGGTKSPGCAYKAKSRKFNAESIFRSAVFGLTALYLRQGSILKASESISKLGLAATDELDELASIAFEHEHFAFATDVYCKIGCTKKELDVRLTSMTRQSQQSKSAIEEFSRTVQSKMHAVNDSDVLLRLALFFQDKDKSLATRLFQLSGNTFEFIRFMLSVLKDVELAERTFELQKDNCQKTAFLMADFFLQNQGVVPDAKSKAIKYFLCSGRKLEALKMAFENNAVEIYCQNVKNFDEKEASMLAKYYASKGQFDQSGKFFLLANQHEKALLSFVKSKDFDSAIELVFKLKDDELFDLMVQVFAGETVITSSERIQDSLLEDGYEERAVDFLEGYDPHRPFYELGTKARLESVPEPVDPIYLFKLYLKFGKTDQANTIALAIIDRELIDGSYKSAYDHGVLIRTQLVAVQARLTTELRNKIIVLHSYVLVKKALKFENHLLAALLLNRVCSFLHYLPKKETDILTSAVIEATKAGLKAIAYNWALTLCKPQYRATINPKLKDKIEKIALKPVNCDELSSSNFVEAGWTSGEGTKSTGNESLKTTVRLDKSGPGTEKPVGRDPRNSVASQTGNVPSLHQIDPKTLSGVAKCPSCGNGVGDSFSLSCGACCNEFVTCCATGKALLVCAKKGFLKCSHCHGIGYEDELREFCKREDCCPVCEFRGLQSFETVELSEIVRMMKN